MSIKWDTLKTVTTRLGAVAGFEATVSIGLRVVVRLGAGAGLGARAVALGAVAAGFDAGLAAGFGAGVGVAAGFGSGVAAGAGAAAVRDLPSDGA